MHWPLVWIVIIAEPNFEHVTGARDLGDFAGPRVYPVCRFVVTATPAAIAVIDAQGCDEILVWVIEGQCHKNSSNSVISLFENFIIYVLDGFDDSSTNLTIDNNFFVDPFCRFVFHYAKLIIQQSLGEYVVGEVPQLPLFSGRDNEMIVLLRDDSFPVPCVYFSFAADLDVS
jgi:hypothetical protein